MERMIECTAAVNTILKEKLYNKPFATNGGNLQSSLQNFGVLPQAMMNPSFNQSYIKITRICFFSDSKVVLASLKTFYAKLKLFFSSRILECQSVILKHGVEVYHVPGKFNYSNEGSKFDTTHNHVLDESFWRAEFLEKDEKFWPVEPFDVSDEALELLQNKVITSHNFQTIFIENCLNHLLQKHRSFKKLSRIIGYVFKMLSHVASGPSFKTRGALLSDMIQKAESYLMAMCNPSTDDVEGLKRQYLVDKTDEATYLVTRAFQMESKVIQQRLRLLDGKAMVGKAILNDIHQHCSGSDKELAAMIDQNLYITHARKYLKDLQANCITCKRIRKVTAEHYMGPSLTEMSSKYPPYYRTHTDVYGPLLCKLTRNITKKFWIGVFSCAWSRHLTLTMLLDMTAAGFLQALKTMSYQNGGSWPRFLHADFGSNIVGITKIDDREDEEEDEDKIPSLDIASLSHVLGENKIELKLSSPAAPWRQGASESLNKVLAQTLKRTNITSQNYHLTQWTHLLSFLSYHINQRTLCTRFVQENLTSISPNNLVYGLRGNFFSASRMELETDNKKLYRSLTKLENELKSWRKVWNLSYLQSVKKYLKFKKKSGDVKEKSIVLVEDHDNPETMEPCLGQVVKKLSERTFVIDYIKRNPKLNNKGKIVRPALHGELTRPIQRLIFLFNPDEENDISLDPFTTGNQEEETPIPASTPVITPELSESIPAPAEDDTTIVDTILPALHESVPGLITDPDADDKPETSSTVPDSSQVENTETLPSDELETLTVPEEINLEIEDEILGDTGPAVTDTDIRDDDKSEPSDEEGKAERVKPKPTLKVTHVGDNAPKVINIVPLIRKKPRKAKKKNW